MYRIARPSKSDRLLAAYSVEKDEGRFEVCTIEDISSSDMTAAFDGTVVFLHSNLMIKVTDDL